MNRLLAPFIVTACLLACLLVAPAPLSGQDEAPPPQNVLTDVQKQAGWRLLFDGAGFDPWRGYRQDNFPGKGWIVEDGALKVCAGGGGGDIITRDLFEEFDLRLEWKVSDKANSGIMYGVSEHEDAPWKTGPEFQIFDDVGYGLAPDEAHSSGALYDLYSPRADKPVKAAGEWNQARIVIRNHRVELWHNGIQVVECDLSSDDWKERIQKSKFHVYSRFGQNKKGHLCLQDHGNDVWFRNIRIRDLTPKPDQPEEALFNGKDMTGWSYFLQDDKKSDDTWRVEEGILICKGWPAGYIFTEKEYTNFKLKLQWRFSPITKEGGNSGVLLRKTGPDKIWPRCVEAQLMSRNAGDFWCIDEFPFTPEASRTKGRNTKKTHLNEHAVGEWNDYEIIVDEGDITLMVNGEVLNQASDAEVIAGKICLQSEGAEIHFRNIHIVHL